MTSKGWEWELNAGLNIGGAAPLGMPREVRKIHSYNPQFNATLEGKVTKWWGRDRLFNSGSTTVRNTLHPLYLDLGFGYSF